jgi:glycosyltransferase involved in cell wall biosynthesis
MQEEYHQLLNQEPSSANAFVDEKMIQEYAEADKIVVPSKYSYNSFIAQGIEKSKLAMVPLLKEKTVMPKSRTLLQASSKTFCLLAIGYNFYRKGFYYLLKAWRQLNLPNAKLIIRNEIPAPFKTLVDHPSIEVCYHRLSDQQLVDLYYRADAFCLPSVDEGFGMVAMEAMAAGLPIIVTEHVGMSDLITNAKEGFILPIRDIDALQKNILYLYENAEVRIEMGNHGMKTESQYSTSAYVNNMLNVYHSMVDAK